MSEVSFDEERRYVIPAKQETRPNILGWLVYYGFAKDERSAKRLALSIVGLAVLASIGLLIATSSGSVSLSPDERAQLEESTSGRY